MRLILCLLMTMTLTGCLRNVSFDGLASTAGATTAAVVGTVVGGPTVGAVLGTAAGFGADVAIEPKGIDLSSVPEEDRADVAKAQFLWQTIQDLGYWIIIAVLAFFLIPLLIGYFLPNGRQRKLEADTYNHPDFKR